MRDSLAPTPQVVDTVAAIETPVPAPHLRTVRVIGKNERGSGYFRGATSTATKTPTLLRDIPQAVTVINRGLIKDQGMQDMGDVVRYVPGITMGQGEGNRDQPTIRGNSTTADFFVNGVRDDAQYFRDLYNVERVEALKGSNAMVFGRGGGGGVINRVMKEADWLASRELTLQGGSYEDRRATLDVGGGLNDRVAVRLNGVYENSGLFRDNTWLRAGNQSDVVARIESRKTRVSIGYENFNDTVQRIADPSFANGPLQTSVSTFFGNPTLSTRSAGQRRIGSAAHTTSNESISAIRLA